MKWKEGTEPPLEMWTSVIGSFNLYVSVDEVDENKCWGTINVWMYNNMSRESFSPFDYLFPGSYQRSQYMWWNWKEKFHFSDVPGYFNGTKTNQGGGW